MKFIAIVLALLPTGSVLSAAIVSTSGAVETITAPASVADNALANNTFARLFFESAGVLAVDVTVDNNVTGPYAAELIAGNAPGVVLPAGTAYESYMLHVDPVAGTATFAGSITFESPIIGVVFTTSDGFPGLDRLGDSDPFFGNPGTNYSGTLWRGLGGQGDGFFISPDARTLSFSFFSFGATDELRIVVAEVPEPSSVALVVGGLVAMALRRRRKF